MISVTQKARWCQKFLERIKKARARGDKHAVSRICGYYRVAIKTAYDWQYKWDGTWRSLVAKSRRPNSHPKAHTEKEIALIIEVRREQGFIAPLLMYQELVERGYTRSYGGMKRFIQYVRFANTTLRCPPFLAVREKKICATCE
jgi:predicted SAM-dependent methyltransferase